MRSNFTNDIPTRLPIFQRTMVGFMTLWLGTFAGLTIANEPALVPFQARAEPVYQELSPEFCWFHPRVAALPGFGKDGNPAVIMTIQKHLVADDHYSGMYFMRTNDLGKTWTGPTEIPELAWRKGENNETISVCDVTPGWHAKSGNLIAIGVKLRYSQAGHQLLDKPRSHEFAYATFDPKTNHWSSWKQLAMPDTDSKFFIVSPGNVQWLELKDGSLLVPTYFNQKDGKSYTTTMLRCSFDGSDIKLLEMGEDLTKPTGLGFVEPSIVDFQGTYYLTLRNVHGAFVTTSQDGLHFQPVQAWTFDDGKDLGSYETQAHWLTHDGGLFLVYTRKGANNDHIARNRAPMFMAQVDTQKLQVIRKTEQVVLPERGVMLGNFGAAAITAEESWITDAEFIQNGKKHPRGADGTVWLGRVKWLPKK
jgi:hypothetical protein